MREFVAGKGSVFDEREPAVLKGVEEPPGDRVDTLRGTNMASDGEPSEPRSLSALSRPLRPGGPWTF